METRVKNYYAYTEEALEKALNEMREWLWYHQHHLYRDKAEFAIEIAWNAKKILPLKEKDPFLCLVIDTLF